jgi:hypothetical protein
MGSHSLSCAAVVTAVSISSTHLYSCGIRLLYSRLPKHCAASNLAAIFFVSVKSVLRMCGASGRVSKQVSQLFHSETTPFVKITVFWDVAIVGQICTDFFVRNLLRKFSAQNSGGGDRLYRCFGMYLSDYTASYSGLFSETCNCRFASVVFTCLFC